MPKLACVASRAFDAALGKLGRSEIDAVIDFLGRRPRRVLAK